MGYHETTVWIPGQDRILTDCWRQSSNPHRDMEHSWTGHIRSERMERMPFTAEKDDFLDNAFQAGFESYVEDQFPEHWSASEKKKAAKKYEAIPEEYYTKSGMRPITPGNFQNWFSRAKGRGLRWHFQEICSGSGRLSLVALLSGMLVGFPVDYRYGWDINLPDHQRMLSQAREEFKPQYLHASPTCTPWSTSSNHKADHVRQAERENEAPALSYLRKEFVKQSDDGLGFGLEQPLTSAMFKDPTSPMHDIHEIPGIRRRQQVDQCAHGCVDEHGVPVKKATVIVGNVKMVKTAKRCNGHKGLPHAVLQGQVGGINRTAKAAVFPMRMCRAIVDDVWKYVKTKNLKLTSWPASLNLMAFAGYKCERCQLGRAALPFMEHTLIPGECRYGRRPPGLEGQRNAPWIRWPLSNDKPEMRTCPLSSSSFLPTLSCRCSPHTT